ncbi:MAG: pilin [Gammaproteobacteria bacterium]|nr:pilin [Gammaproteobacteria bacterium]
MIVVAIIGILAAIAIPTYQDFTVRAKVSEALVSVGPAKVGVSEYYSALAEFPTDAVTAGFQSNYDTKFVNSVRWNLGTLSLEVYMKSIGTAIATDQTIFIEATGTEGAVDWNCDTALGGTVLPEFVPADCRTNSYQ